jgi:diaminopimelate decarboxylase
MLLYGEETKSQPITAIEPGTFLLANGGFVVTKVIDRKSTKECNFLLLNGGMELNTRPLLYGSKHPFYVVSK